MDGSDLDMNFLDGRIRVHRIHIPCNVMQSFGAIDAPDSDCDGKKKRIRFLNGSSPDPNQNPVLSRVESGYRIMSNRIRNTLAIR